MQSLQKILQCFFQNYGIENNETIKSERSNEKSYKKLLQKQRKASGNGEYNLIKYVRMSDVITTQDMKPQCVLLRF